MPIYKRSSCCVSLSFKFRLKWKFQATESPTIRLEASIKSEIGEFLRADNLCNKGNEAAKFSPPTQMSSQNLIQSISNFKRDILRKFSLEWRNRFPGLLKVSLSTIVASHNLEFSPYLLLTTLYHRVRTRLECAFWFLCVFAFWLKCTLCLKHAFYYLCVFASDLMQFTFWFSLKQWSPFVQDACFKRNT